MYNPDNEDNLTQGQYFSAAINEYARNHGEVDTERQWILTPFDTWVANPHYRGEDNGHPEEVHYPEEAEPIEEEPAETLSPENYAVDEWPDDFLPF